MTILGIDPGIANTGFAIVEKSKTGYKCLLSGFIKTCPTMMVGKRLGCIIEAIEPHIGSVDIIGVERVFFAKNVSSALSTANVIGAIELIAHQASVPCVQILPNAVKAAVGGAGGSSKPLVRQYIKILTGKTIKNHHEADAIATAIAAFQTTKGGRDYARCI